MGLLADKMGVESCSPVCKYGLICLTMLNILAQSTLGNKQSRYLIVRINEYVKCSVLGHSARCKKLPENCYYEYKVSRGVCITNIACHSMLFVETNIFGYFSKM
jgi:hypothetical protein